MTKKELAKFEKLLLDERHRLLTSIKTIEDASRNESVRDSGGDFSSYAETGTDSFELETALNIASAESDRLSEIDEALQRIKDGTYGICEGTGEPIPKKRLEVFPAARFSIEHQAQLEREQRGQYR